MIIYNKKSNDLTENMISIFEIGIDMRAIALMRTYSGNFEGFDIVLVEDTKNITTCNLKYPSGLLKRSYLLFSGNELGSKLTHMEWKVDGERVMELYGVNDDELESDLTVEQLREKALLRVSDDYVSKELEERCMSVFERENIENITTVHDKNGKPRHVDKGYFDIYWKDELIAIVIYGECKNDSKFVCTMENRLERQCFRR